MSVYKIPQTQCDKCKSQTKSDYEKMGFIGGGKIAKLIAEGILRKGLAQCDQLYVAGPHVDKLVCWTEKCAHVFLENGKVVEEADVIFLSVKPHMLAAAITGIFDTLPQKCLKSKLFVSIMPGVPIQQLDNALNRLEGCRIIRAMPNSPILIGEGCTVFSSGPRTTESDLEFVKAVFSVHGICRQVPESLINAACALSESGSAFIYVMIEALADGGVKMGLPRAIAIEFATQTVLGTAKMVKETGKHTGQLKDELCIPGGSTITAIHALEKGGIRAAIIDAIEAAAIKSAELGDKKRNLISISLK